MAKGLRIFLILLALISVVFFIIMTNDNNEIKKPDKQDKNPVEEGPVAGGEITIGTNFSNLSLDPLKLTSSKTPINAISTIIYRGILGNDDQLNLELDLGSKIDIKEKKIELTLKKLTFADGSPITIEDVKYSYEWYSQTGYNGYWKNFTFDIKGSSEYRSGRSNEVIGITVNPDTNTVVIQYDKLDAKDLQLLTAPILSKKQLEGKSVNDIKDMSLKGELLATGPYKVKTLNEDEILLTKNNNYEKKVYLDSLIFQNYVPGSNYDLIVGLPQFADINKEKEIIQLSGQGYTYLGMNLNNNDLSNTSIRKAISLGLDNNNIINDLYMGYAEIPDSPLHPKSWAHQSSDVEKSVDEAKSLLQGKKVTLELAYGNTGFNRNLAKEIANQLTSLGIQINLKPIPMDQYIPTLFSKGEFDLFIADWPYEFDPVFENEKWLTKNDVLLGGYNISHVNNDTNDRLLLKAGQTLQVAERKEIYKEWQNNFKKNYFIVPIASPQTIFIVNPNLNLNIKNSLVPYLHVNEWWINE